MNSKFLDFIEKYKDQTVALAVSGGVDSIAMLHWYAASGLPCVALTVDHGLRSTSALEAKAVEKMAKKLGVPHTTLHWTGDKPTANLEDAARKARYDLMFDWCQKNNIEVLMTAHQADDQIETFLMNLSRGSGVYGLSGIRRESQREGITIARPLLDVFRAELKDWCDANKIKYFKDEMNEDENFTRVRIRKNRHFLRDKLGISDQRILLAVDNLARAREALEKQVEAIIPETKFPSCGGVGEAGGGLANLEIKEENKIQQTIAGLAKPPRPRQKAPDTPPTEGNLHRIIITAAQLFSFPDELQLKFLGEALRRVSRADYSPRLSDIQRLLNRLRHDTVSTLSNCRIRRFKEKILIVREGDSISFNTSGKK